MSTATEPLSLPLLPLAGGVIFPEMVVTIRAESAEARAAVDSAGRAGDQLLLVPRTNGRFATVGVVARLEQRHDHNVVVRGLFRARVGQGVIGATTALWVQAEPLVTAEPDATTRALADEYREVATELLETVGGRPLAGLLRDATDPGSLADTIAWWPGLDYDDRVRVLETVELNDRLTLALGLARDALAEAQVSSKIAGEVQSDLAKKQREAILRRQLEAIRNELGEGADDTVGDYRRRLADAALPDDVHTAVAKEIDRLERVGEQNIEASWTRTWLDTVFELPWGAHSDDNLDLAHARQILDADHTGLDDVKDRIVEFLGVRKLREVRGASTEQRGGAIVVLVGPPGVGKTSLGESIARALGRAFVRTSLGGIHDEAEIRGHRRTYVGARPGRIARAMIDAGSMNPVILLDEIDKVGADWRGDPSSALLEVLDPAQNHTFRDHYLEFNLDLSSVLFIATANTLDRVPAPLLDRMEVIVVNGYSDDEKLSIARDHLLGRLLQRNAVHADEVQIADELIRLVISDYTREAGVRRLEQRLDRLVRKAATKIAEGAPTPVVITADDVRTALGAAPVEDRPADRVTLPGIATGLAVTGAGGDVLFVEAAALPGEPGLTLTGQLGDVMRESAEIAVSYLRSHADSLGIAGERLAQRLHVHFPAGAVPKDGPSAGITMTTALASLLTDRRVRADVGMTGEVTLHGKVLPIGGVKEKVLAAHRAGLRTVILPAANRADADKLPADVKAAVTLHFVDDVSQVLPLALEAAA